MNLRHLMASCCAVLAFACGNGTGPGETPTPPPPARSRLYIVFFDLTRSLNPAQEASTTHFLQELCKGMPARSRVYVFPMGGYVARAGALVQTDLPDDDFASQRTQLKNRRNALPQLILQAAGAFRERITNRDFLRKTCISDAFRHAAQLSKEFADYDVEVVFVSDMLEDCNSSLVGGAVSLEKHDIANELQRARDLEKNDAALPGLQGANITALVPPLGGDTAIVAGPELHDLRHFWATVLERYNHNPERFYLGTTFPRRLKSGS